MRGIVNFLKDVAREMRKVSWPKPNELRKYTITVIVTVLFLVLFFMLVDLGISQLIKLVS